MSEFYHKPTAEIRELSPELFGSWVMAGNPKASDWLPVTDSNERPERATEFELTIGPTEVLRTWKASLPSVPASVPAWRVKAIADALGLTPQIEAIIDSLPVPQRYAVRRSWTDGNEIERHASSTVAIGAALGRTPEEIDQWFRDAAALVV